MEEFLKNHSITIQRNIEGTERWNNEDLEIPDVANAIKSFIPDEKGTITIAKAFYGHKAKVTCLDISPTMDFFASGAMGNI